MQFFELTSLLEAVQIYGMLIYSMVIYWSFEIHSLRFFKERILRHSIFFYA